MIERLAAFICQHPKRVTIALAVITGFLAIQVTHLKSDFTPQALFSKRASAYEFYASFVEEFGSDETFLIMVIRGDDIFTSRGIGLLDEFTREVDALPALENTRSLTNCWDGIVKRSKGDEPEMRPYTKPCVISAPHVS